MKLHRNHGWVIGLGRGHGCCATSMFRL